MLLQGKTIIISSQVAYGYVGGSMTSFMLRINGQEPFVIPTVLYSNHLGFDTVDGDVVPSPLFDSLLNGITMLDAFAEVDAVVTGFFNSVDQVMSAATFIRALKVRNPNLHYVCDPIMGDFKDEGLYIDAAVADALVTHLLPMADVLTPNHFEMAYILGKPVNSLQALEEAYAKRADLQEKKIVVTGYELQQAAETLFYNLLLEAGRVSHFQTDIVDLYPTGTGDLFAVLLYLQQRMAIPLADAVPNCAAIVVQLLQTMRSEGRKDFEVTDLLQVPPLLEKLKVPRAAAMG